MTRDEQQKGRPLWEVMAEAYAAVNNMPADLTGMTRSGNAAEICAIADWLVPEEVGHPFDDNETMHHIDARMYIRQRLLGEADRAERGER